MLNFINQIFLAVLGYLKADWYILLIGILLAVTINVYVDSTKLKKFFERKTGVSIPGAVAFGALTPLCACGTTAVLLSMFISSLPWGPVMAFLISSPLTSPSEYMFETAFIGNRFATALVISSVVLGIGAGVAAHLLEKKTKFFENQFRLVKDNTQNCCSKNSKKKVSLKGKLIKPSLNVTIKAHQEICCSNGDTSNKITFIERYKLNKFLKELYNIGVKKILFYFVIFIAIGQVVEIIIPKDLVLLLFSSNKAYSIPLGATIGLPLYLNDSSALPLLKSFINAGAGEGTVLAFLIAGKATGIPVMAGMSTIMKKRAMAFYIGFIYVGAIIAGYTYQLLINLKF